MTERILFSIHPRYLITRIAENSSILNDIQDQGGDGFNISEGYPAAYAKPFDQGGKPLNRAELNNIFNLLSQLHFYWQMGGAPLWDRRIAEGEGMYAPLSGYPRNARVHKMIETNLIEFISQKDNNTVEPILDDPTKSWKKVTLGDDAASKKELSAVSSDIESTILALSGNAKTTDGRLATTISTLSGYAKAADIRLETEISNLSGYAKAADISLAASISILSGNASSTDSLLGSRIAELSSGTGSEISAITEKLETLSGYAKETDIRIGTEVSSISGYAKAADIRLETEISTISANAKTTDEYLERQIIELSSQPKESKVLNVVSDKTSVIEILQETGHGSDVFHSGDVLIVTNTVSSCQFRSSYAYDGKDWCACNGYYDAAKILIDTPLDLAGNYKAIGNLDKGSTGAVVKDKFPKGTSIQDIISQMIDQVVDPSIKSYPKNTIVLKNGSGGAEAGEVEVGNEFTPYYSITFTDGKFTCAGTDTSAGCSDSVWAVTDTEGTPASTKSGSIYSKFTVGDGTPATPGGEAVGISSYNVAAVTTYGESNKAKNNKGAETSLTIPASSTQSASSTTVSGIRLMFWGMDTGTENVTSSTIRSLASTQRKKPAAGDLPRLKSYETTGATRCIVAIPSTYDSLKITSVTLPNSMGAQIKDLFIKTDYTVSVEGFNGYPGITYNVWVYKPASIGADEEYDITIG